jgi:hypothetical protein
MWQSAANLVGDVTADMASQSKRVTIDGNKVVVVFNDKHVCEYCRKSDRSDALKNALAQLSGSPVALQFEYEQRPQSAPQVKRPKMTRVQMLRQLEQHEMVKTAIEIFDAEIIEFREIRRKS